MVNLGFKITLKTLAIPCLIVLFSVMVKAQAYKLDMLTSSEPTNLRGLCPVTDSTIWVCGNYGRIGRSLDGGKNWAWAVPKGYEKSDFRDIEAFDENHAVVMASGYPAVILYTADGGKKWNEAFRSDDTLAFLDAIDFWDAKNGVCIGDWLNNSPYTLITNDGGKSWQLAQNPTIGQMKEGTVASFAASGTCLRSFINNNNKRCFIYAIGGTNTGIITAMPNKKGHYVYEFKEIPYETPAQSQGIFSLCYDTLNKTVWVAGGDYSLPSLGFSGTYNTTKKEFTAPKGDVSGYRSCIELFENNGTLMVLSCGLNGADITSTGSEIVWEPISTVPLNSVIKSKKGNAVFLCGPQGTIYKLSAKE